MASRLETTGASRLPCFASRSMLAREAPVSAVSLAAKNAETSSRKTTMENASQSIRLQSLQSLDCSRQLALEKSRTRDGSTSAAITARPTASNRMKVSRPRLTFLSCAISVISASASASPSLSKSCDILQMGRQTDLGKVTSDPRRVGFGDHAE